MYDGCHLTTYTSANFGALVTKNALRSLAPTRVVANDSRKAFLVPGMWPATASPHIHQRAPRKPARTEQKRQANRLNTGRLFARHSSRLGTVSPTPPVRR